MSLLLLPASISLLLKLFILWTVIKGGRVSILFLSLIAIFALHNSVELFGYILLVGDNSVEALFRPYYVITIYLLMYVLLHGLTIASISHRFLTAATIAVATTLSGLVIFTDSIVDNTRRKPLPIQLIRTNTYSFSVLIHYRLQTARYRTQCGKHCSDFDNHISCSRLKV